LNFASSNSDGSNTTDRSNYFFSPVNFDVNSLSNIPSLDLLITTTEINHEIEITISTALSSNKFFSSFELRLVLWFDDFGTKKTVRTIRGIWAIRIRASEVRLYFSCYPGYVKFENLNNNIKKKYKISISWYQEA
jgi:hypothetical protein